MAGAEYHDAKMCTNKHFIRPVLFTFFRYSTPELKAFIKERLGTAVWEEGVEPYRNWLTAPPGNDAPNHIKLYWWILAFWGRLDR